MLSKLVARWKGWRAHDRADETRPSRNKEIDAESPEELHAKRNHGPGGWTPLGNLSKLSEDE